VIRRQALFLCATLLGAMGFPAQTRAEGPDPAVAQIRRFYDALLAVMKDAARLGIRGRYDKLAPAVRAAFDLPAMTRIAVGPAWNSIPPEQRSALTESFSRMTIATYANRFDGYSGERFETADASEARNTGRIVRTKLIPSTGAPVTLDYLVRDSGNVWKIVDVYLMGTISELATRRSEFSAILDSGGAEALVAGLDQQVQKLMRAPGTAK